MLGVLKIGATCLTVGSGGSAGDFGPSLVIGGIFGGAFGRAAALLLHDGRIDPGAFALVGMGTRLYGGLAHVPIASLVMTCELAGSYDLLVPLMLAEGIAFVALRHRSLYHAQVPTRRDSPAHREDLIFDVLTGMRVGEVLVRDRPYAAFTTRTRAFEIIQKAAAMAWQDVFPVLDEEGKLVGIVLSEVLRTMAANPDLASFAIAHDLMIPPVSVRDTDDLQRALEVILEHGLREIVVVDDAGRIVEFPRRGRDLRASTTTRRRAGGTSREATKANAPAAGAAGAHTHSSVTRSGDGRITGRQRPRHPRHRTRKRQPPVPPSPPEGGRTGLAAAGRGGTGLAAAGGGGAGFGRRRVADRRRPARMPATSGFEAMPLGPTARALTAHLEELDHHAEDRRARAHGVHTVPGIVALPPPQQI